MSWHTTKNTDQIKVTSVFALNGLVFGAVAVVFNYKVAARGDLSSPLWLLVWPLYGGMLLAPLALALAICRTIGWLSGGAPPKQYARAALLIIVVPFFSTFIGVQAGLVLGVPLQLILGTGSVTMLHLGQVLVCIFASNIATACAALGIGYAAYLVGCRCTRRNLTFFGLATVTSGTAAAGVALLSRYSYVCGIPMALHLFGGTMFAGTVGYCLSWPTCNPANRPASN